MKKIFHPTIAKANLLLIVIILGFLGYSLFGPITPATYSKPLIVNKDSLLSGHTLTYKTRSCRHVGEGVVTTITRQLVSTTNKDLQPIVLSNDTLTNPSGCRNNTKTLIIPFATPEGEYRLVIRGVYQVFPLRSPIAVTTESDPVRIKVSTVSQTIQELIDANTLLQQQLIQSEDSKAPVNGSKSTTTTNQNGSTSTSTTTNTTTTNNPPEQQKPTPKPTSNGLIQDIIKALGGSPIVPKL